MPEALRRHLTQESSNFIFEVHKLDYETSNDQLTTTDFAQTLGRKIKEIAGPLGPADRISLVMHSQGGLIGSILLFNSAQGNLEYYPELAKHLDSFITLGSPMWGAKIAQFASEILPNTKPSASPLSRFGNLQLKDMHLLSSKVMSFRNRVIQPDFQTTFEELNSRIQFVQIAGVATKLKLLSPYVSGKNQYEDDMAVPLPSARFDFWYYSDRLSNPANASVGQNSFRKTKMADEFLIVDAIHDNGGIGSKIFKDEKFIPRECLQSKPQECDHPAYMHIFNTLLHRPRVPLFQFKPTSFLLSYRFHIKNQEPLNEKKLKITVVSKSPYTKIKKTLELYNSRFEVFEPHEIRGYEFGYLDANKIENDTLTLEIQYDRRPKRRIQVPVEPATSTFLELDL